MKILLTGGAGFIGFHTAKALLERGDELTIVDSFNEYYDPELKEARICELEKLGKFKLVRTDISDYKAMEAVFEDGFDKVCHLAAQAGVRYSLTDPFSYNQSNLTGMLNILELCRHSNVKDLVFASTSSVYGNNKKTPFSESDKTDTQLSFYAATKKANEVMAYSYHNLYGLNCTGLRFFTVYGTYGRPDLALFKFTKNMLEGKEIEVFNNGHMKRDFTYVTDLVSGIISALDNPFPYEIFNLGRGAQVGLDKFIKEIENCLGVKSKQKLLPMQQGDVPETLADISKAKKMLGYDPKIDYEEGIQKFVDWYKEYYKK